MRCLLESRTIRGGCGLRWKRDRPARRVLQPSRENFHARFGDEKSVLELGRTLTVYRNRGPIVGPGGVLVAAQGDHGLDCKCHASCALSNALVLSVMWHVGRTVELCVDAVPDVGSYHSEVLGLGMLLYNVAKFLNGDAWLDVGDGLF